MDASSLTVTSHVGRDLLASAAHFKDAPATVWEYVVNSLQYSEPGVPPRVQVTVRPRKKEIIISDNGRGMDATALKHFFTMHGENIERAEGRIGRGKFGTGKSAAFGIARRLCIDTRREGLRNVVGLTRDTIDSTSGEDIPLDWQLKDEPTDLPNGTIVTIGDIVLQRRLTTTPIIERIERHLQGWRGTGAEVAVNQHVCEYRKPLVVATHTFKPTGSHADVIGDVELKVEVGLVPLSDSDQGIVVTAGEGNQVAVETAGIEAKQFGNYLFGNIDVPALETSDSPIEPYDSSRSYSLNPSHPVAVVLLSFIGSKLEEVRRQLVEQEKEARKTEHARRLAKQADKIAEILNEDYRRIQRRLQEIRSASAAAGSTGAQFGASAEGGSEEDIWIEGTEQPGNVETSGTGAKGAGPRGRPSPEIPARGEPDPSGSSSVDPAGGEEKKGRKPKGGFSVKYDRLGRDEHRSRYDPTGLVILINLDHPVVAAAMGDGQVEDPIFRRLSYEIAFSEYALALGYERTHQDPEVPADDVLYDVREDLNRVSRAAASLYR